LCVSKGSLKLRLGTQLCLFSIIMFIVEQDNARHKSEIIEL